jgi:hypothetical protein
VIQISARAGRPGLSDEDGVLSIRSKAALAGYVLRRWNIDCSETHCLRGPEYRLWLRNRTVLDGVDSAHIAPGYLVEGSGHEAPCENSILSCGLPPYPALKQLSSYTFAGVTISMQETQLARHRLFLQQEDAKLGWVRLLLDAGADPMLVDSSGMDALPMPSKADVWRLLPC